MLREVTTHLIPELPDVAELRVFAGDDRVKHGTPHFYAFGQKQSEVQIGLYFQMGDPRQGWNGGTSLSYLAAVRDFLECCQGSQFACEENKQAICSIALAMEDLKHRIRRRHAEGTMHTQQVGAGEIQRVPDRLYGVSDLELQQPIQDRIDAKVAAPAKSNGELAYEGYFAKCGGKSLISGAPLPTYAQQKPEIQEAWEAAAAAVIASA